MLTPLPPREWTPIAAAHLLNRAGFGGSPAEIHRLHCLGHSAAVAALLDADEDFDLFPAPEIAPMQRPTPGPKAQIHGAEVRALARRQTLQLRDWWLRRMRSTPNPAREKAVLFWHGHWATSIQKVRDPFLLLQQNETLRAHALGEFGPMTKEMTRDPAMIRYLDLQTSETGKPNENFSRELMELFTLGEGHYSEEDVREAARAFTGHRYNPRTGTFELARRRHDKGVKTFLGRTGCFNGDEVVDIIVSQPRCAEFISKKLWTFYAGENPPQGLLDTLADAYRDSGLHTGDLLRRIFTSRAFYAPVIVRSQIKSPVQWLVQACKILEIPLPAAAVSLKVLTELGQTLFAPPNVKGWDGGRAWISSSTLLLRHNLAGQIVRGAGGRLQAPDIDTLIPPGAVPSSLCDALGERLFQSPMSPALRAKATTFLDGNGTSPAARRDLLHLLLSTPEFQLS